MASIRNILNKLRSNILCEGLLAFYYHIFMFVPSSTGKYRKKLENEIERSRHETAKCRAQAVTDVEHEKSLANLREGKLCQAYFNMQRKQYMDSLDAEWETVWYD